MNHLLLLSISPLVLLVALVGWYIFAVRTRPGSVASEVDINERLLMGFLLLAAFSFGALVMYLLFNLLD